MSHVVRSACLTVMRLSWLALVMAFFTGCLLPGIEEPARNDTGTGGGNGGPDAGPFALRLHAGSYMGSTVGRRDQFSGDCIPAGAPDDILEVEVPARTRVNFVVRGITNPMLAIYDPHTGRPDCNRTATYGGGIGQRLSWFNPENASASLTIIVDWSGGFPNPSAIPSSGPYSLDVSFDDGLAEGESCRVPTELALPASTLVAPGIGENDEGPAGQVDHVYRLTIPPQQRVEVTFDASGLSAENADIRIYEDPSKCGTSAFSATGQLLAGASEPFVWRSTNTGSTARSVVILVDARSPSSPGRIAINAVASPL